ncbi:MAG: alpha amylase C-terminal domain-containing protein [Bacteroidales bacterium]|nr:alpha amylase C-terminal domain-containing protein [Bacteroidales bacterium]
MYIPDYVKRDPFLMPHHRTVTGRLRKAFDKEKHLCGVHSSLSEFAMGHHYYGLHKHEHEWVLREWAPNATAVYFLGDVTSWMPSEQYKLKPLSDGNWEIRLPLDRLRHHDQYKLHVCWDGGSGDRIPAWAFRVVQDQHTLVFNAQVWDPPEHYRWKHDAPAAPPRFPIIYEAHPGMATESYKVGTWEEFRLNVLPDVEKAGYNTIQLMAVQEHPFYGSFGYHVSNYFAPSSRFGTPEELKALIDDAHGRGIYVIMDIVHSHAVKNEIEGISRYDGTYYQFFHDGKRGEHPAWDSRCFNYGKDQVLHFLLSNCRYWLEEFRFDGFRFDGVTSMLYLDHGLGSHFQSYDQYYNLNQDEDAIVYLFLANKLIHEFSPSAFTVAEEMSGMPGLAAPESAGGIGFDYRLAMGVPDFWIKTIKEKKVEFWHVGEIFHQLQSKRPEEKTIHYAESHDQALVGDKTIIFWLIDKEMYHDMHKDSRNLAVDNGIALHKMIRLITMGTAGNGYLNFMGNEFGHPEWIDFPNAHNNWSYHYARRQWSLAAHPDLKYKYLAAFDRAMVRFAVQEDLLSSADIRMFREHVSDQVLIFGRGRLLFVFNFSPFRSYTDYPATVPRGVYEMLLDSDAVAFGGQGRVDASINYPAQEGADPAFAEIKLYIPALSGFVLRKK